MRILACGSAVALILASGSCAFAQYKPYGQPNRMDSPDTPKTISRAPYQAYVNPYTYKPACMGLGCPPATLPPVPSARVTYSDTTRKVDIRQKPPTPADRPGKIQSGNTAGNNLMTGMQAAQAAQKRKQDALARQLGLPTQ